MADITPPNNITVNGKLLKGRRLFVVKLQGEEPLVVSDTIKDPELTKETLKSITKER